MLMFGHLVRFRKVSWTNNISTTAHIHGVFFLTHHLNVNTYLKFDYFKFAINSNTSRVLTVIKKKIFNLKIDFYLKIFKLQFSAVPDN